VRTLHRGPNREYWTYARTTGRSVLGPVGTTRMGTRETFREVRMPLTRYSVGPEVRGTGGATGIATQRLGIRTRTKAGTRVNGLVLFQKHQSWETCAFSARQRVGTRVEGVETGPAARRIETTERWRQRIPGGETDRKNRGKSSI
jgi:hypothetical protein